MSTIKIKLNLVPGTPPGGILPEVRVSQNDAVDRVLQFELYDGAEEADLSEVTQIYFGGTKPDGNGFTVTCAVSDNVATAALTPQSTVLAGDILCKLYLIYSTGSVRSATFTLAVDPDPLNGAGSSDTDLQDIVAAASMYAAEAEESAENAASAAQEAAEAALSTKLDKVDGDSKDVITTFTSQDNAADTGLIVDSGQELTISTVASGETQSSLFNKITGLALNLRRTVNAVKKIWTGVSDNWDPNSHSYVEFDMVWYNGTLRKCKLAHTSSDLLTPDNTTYWEDTNVGAEICSLNANYANLNKIGTYAWENKSLPFTSDYAGFFEYEWITNVSTEPSDVGITVAGTEFRNRNDCNPGDVPYILVFVPKGAYVSRTIAVNVRQVFASRFCRLV